MTLLMRLRYLLGRTEALPQLRKDLLELSGNYFFDFDDPGSLRNIPMIRLHRPAFSVSFTVENSGSVFGGEVRSWPLEFTLIYLLCKKKSFSM